MTGKAIRETSLGNLKYLASGGFAEVFAVPGFTLPGDTTPLAYKRFTVDHAQQTRSAQAAVKFREALSPADRADLDERTTWPRALVTGPTGSVRGLLMPLIPPEFFFQAPDLAGKLVRRPREMSWLVSSAEQRNAAQVDFGDVPRTDRLVMLAQLAYVVGWLHKHGWVFGDLSFSNAVFALDPPRILLLDCDGAAALADHSRKQSSTPFWDPPECPIEQPPGGRKQERQDDITDVYKLGLAILRCLTPGKGASSSRNVKRLGTELDAAGTDLVTRSLSDDRGVRPRARQIYAYLRQAATGRIAVPQITLARLVTPCRIRGLDAHIEWQIDKANEVQIRFGVNQAATVALADHPQGYTFQPQRSGPVSIEARNRFGTARVELGELILYDLPEFQVNLAALPALHVPEIDPFCTQSLEVTIAGRPRSPAGIKVPRLPAVNSADLVSTLFPAMKAPALPPIGGAVNAASGDITSIIRGARSTFDELLREKFVKENKTS
jgi:serine/threonine protein kinase